ncbi:MAG: 16S rRNA (cytidine(1402)-2'-O)-methyltransferase [Firmicutes bacterium]|nr:16S rRNA (cytidine(1402)-2'-O)-methyltransferase [Bacillota bacterium]
MEGRLSICATPIGNLEDITLRVLRTLKEADLIAAEDTRQTIKLLNAYDIETPMISYHKFNEQTRGPQLVQMMQEGKHIALVSDAGTPGISDPGETLIRLCYEAGVPVTSLPGPSAFVTAMTLSGLHMRRFIFEGFLPTDKKELQALLDSLRTETRPVLFYEAPHHLTRTLETLRTAVGDRRVVTVRELTKKHEERCCGTIAELLAAYEKEPPRGEFVIIVDGADPEMLRQEEEKRWEDLSIEEHMALYPELPEKEAMKRVARERGIRKQDVYAALKS